MVEVTQADREAAAGYFNSTGGMGHSDYADRIVQSDDHDDCPEIQAFAKHRIQSTADLQAKLHKAVEVFSEAMEKSERLKEALWDLVDKAIKMQGNEK